MLRLLAIALVLFLLVAGAVAWSSSSADRPADFSFINRGDIITLDPNQMSYLQDFRMAYGMWEDLYVYDPETLKPIPGVAKSVDISDDKRTYTFHLRDNARWSNGDPVVANDFIFAWRRMLETPGEYTYLHFYIKGAEGYELAFAKHYDALMSGLPDVPPLPDYSTVGVKSPDGHTLIVTLNDPVSYFLDVIAFTPFAPLHEKSMERFKLVEKDRPVRYDQEFTRPPNVVTNGPYKLVEWDFKRHLRLERNPYYWNPASVKNNSVEMVVVEDALTQFKRYDFGKVDWLADVPTEMAAELKKSGRPDLRVFPGYGTAYINVNCKPKFNNGEKNPLADKRVRQALVMALDKQNIVDTVTRMGELPATTYVPPSIFEGYETTPGLPHDVARARALLAEAGFPDGRGLPKLPMLFRSDIAFVRDLVQNISRQWHETLNLDIRLESVESKTYRERVNNQDYALAPGNWIGDYADPSTFTDKYLANSVNNDSKWVNAAYEKLCAAATRELDAKKRLRLLENAERILNDDCPVLPLYYIVNVYMFRDNVKGLYLHPRNTSVLKNYWVDRTALR